VVLLCLASLLLHAKPSEPHLVPYLLLVKGFSAEDVTSRIFPVYTYADLAATLALVPLSQALGCKRVIVGGALCRLGTRALLLWGTGLPAMQGMQVLYGMGVASEALFTPYVLALQVPAALALTPGLTSPARRQGPAGYQSAASAIAAAALVGYMAAAEGGQLALAAGASLTALFYASALTVVRISLADTCRALTPACAQAGGAALTMALPSDTPSRRVVPGDGKGEVPLQTRVAEVRGAGMALSCLER